MIEEKASFFSQWYWCCGSGGSEGEARGGGGAVPLLSHGLDDRPPYPPYLKDWIRHCVVLLPL